MRKKDLKNRIKLGSEIAILFLMSGTVALGELDTETTATAEKYVITPINPTLNIPERIDRSTFPSFTPRFKVFTAEDGGATQYITSTNSKKPDIFEAGQTGVAYDHGLWVSASSYSMNYGQNKADISNTDNDNQSYGIAVMEYTGQLTYINYGNVTATGNDSVGMMVNSYDARKVFTNYGTIMGSDYALEIWGTSDSPAQVTFNNYGTLIGDVGLFPQMGGAVYVSNYKGGVVNGNVRIVPGDTTGSLSRFSNLSGATINGNVLVSGNLILSGASTEDYPGAGSITMNNNGGTINGDVWLNGGTKGYMTTGQLLLYNDNGGVINGNVTLLGRDTEAVAPSGVNVNAVKFINEGTVNGTIIASGVDTLVVNDRYYTDVGMVAGTIESGRGDFGIVASKGGRAENFSYVINEGDFGMLALMETSIVVNEGGVGNGTSDTVGNYGMAALYGGSAENRAAIGNSADYGMLASGVGETGINSTVYNSGIITNDGNYGMVAIDGGIAVNENGTIGNYKNGGMVASGTESVAVNNGIIQNLANDGMVSTKGASIYNNSTINNAGDVGMFIDTDSYGYNDGTINNQGNTGVFVNGYFLNRGTIDPVNEKGEVPTYAVVAGNGNGRVIFINPGADVHNPIPNSSAILMNTDGMDVLQFGAENEGAQAVLNSDTKYFNYLLGSGWLRSTMSSGNQTTKADDEYTAVENTWTLNGNHIFLGGTSLADEHSELANAIQTNKENVLDTNIVMGANSSVTFVMGRNKNNDLTSPMVLAKSYDTTNGTHNHVVLDDAFITNSNEIVFRVGKVTSNIGNWSIPSGERVIYTDAEGIDNNIATRTASLGAGWTPHHEIDSEGNLYLVYVRDNVPGSDTDNGSISGDDSSSGGDSSNSGSDSTSGGSSNETNSIPYTPNNPAPGGYGEAQSYPHTNLDVINSRNILNRGYLLAKRLMFARPKATGERYENYVFAELFGDWGDYTGAGARFSYQTSGVTIGNFHRFESNPEWMAGVTYGYAHSKANFKRYKGSNEKINTLGLNAFLTWSRDNWIVTGTVGYSWSGHDLKRKFADYDSPLILGLSGVNSIARQASKKFDSNGFSTGFELGYNYRVNSNFTIYPYLGFDYIFNKRDGYTENADGMAGISAITGDLYTSKYTLQVNKNDYNTGVAKLGVITEWLIRKWAFSFDVAYSYYTSKYDCITGSYVDAADRGEKVVFHSSKLDVGKQVGSVTASANYKITEDWIVGAEFTGYYRKKQAGNLVGANLTYRF
jgi:hypothetical protein